MNTTDTAEGLQIYRHDRGIKLVRPKKSLAHYRSVKSILKLPFQVYFENTEQVTLQGNEIYADVNGFISLKECLGEKWHKPFKKNTVIPTILNDRKVIEHNKHIIVEEIGFRNDGTEVHTLSVRMPWYNMENKIIGLFGCSISLGKAPLADSLSQLADLGFLNPTGNIANMIGSEINNVYLSKRQLECAKLILNGLTAKEIGAVLKLSTRTIEGYINSIKTKLSCYNRSELILKLSEIFKSS